MTIISSKSKREVNLGYVGTWIYWGIELASVTVMATYRLVAGAAAPFCSACNSWKEVRHLGTLNPKRNNVADDLTSGEIERLKEHDPALIGGGLILTVAVCPRCESRSSIAVRMEEVTKNAKGEEGSTEVVHLTYPGEALAGFEALFWYGHQPEEGN